VIPGRTDCDRRVHASPFTRFLFRGRMLPWERGGGPLEQNDNQLGFQSSYGGANGPSDENMQACYDEFMTQVGPIRVSQRTPLTR
jgi:hypothetical protein